MKTIPALLFAAVLAVGLLGGVAAYQAASGPAAAGSSAASPADAGTTPTAERTRHVRPKVRWAPCQPPAVRQGKACVTEEVRTVVVPAPAPAAPAAPAARPVRAAGDDHAEDHGADHAEDRGDDHAEDHGDDGHEDDGGEHEDD